MKPEDTDLQVTTFEPSDVEEWEEYVGRSSNGTLFHSLRFLAYHPPGRFTFHHLTIRRNGDLICVIPGGASGDGLFCSPLGASVGGPVFPARTSQEDVIRCITALQAFVTQSGWRGISITLAPSVVHRVPSQSVEFALSRCGFHLAKRWLPLMIPLDFPGPDRYLRLFSKGHRSAVRKTRRDGCIEITSGGIDQLEGFLPLLDDTFSRLRATPTHTHSEIADLLTRMPDRVQIRSAELDGIPVSATLLFRLTLDVWTTFYICDRFDAREHHASSYLFAELIDELAAHGIRYLDLGPSASTQHYNAGVASFKEHLGARAFCRDQYEWSGEL
jgi:Acetyltransferase (GNAT) domain